MSHKPLPPQHYTRGAKGNMQELACPGGLARSEETTTHTEVSNRAVLLVAAAVHLSLSRKRHTARRNTAAIFKYSFQQGSDLLRDWESVGGG